MMRIQNVCTVTLLFGLVASCISASAGAKSDWISPPEDFWLTNLLGNILSYAVVVVPAGFLIKYLQNNPDRMTGQGFIWSCVRLCVVGQPDVSSSSPSSSGSDSKGDTATKSEAEVPAKKEDSPVVAFLKLGFCAIGLQMSYLTWGALQEQIMTQSYGEEKEQFKNSQFLVFVNRILAFFAAFLIIQCSQQPKHTVPVHKYSYPSLSNVMSSWFQYEALKFVSFPTQVVAKASKVIPVMLMGKLVSKTEYANWEYGVNIALSIGVAMFSFSQAGESKDQTSEESSQQLVGIFLLLGYLFFDSFTSNYQSALFKQHKMSKFQMMFGVNLFSCFFTMWSLVQTGNLAPAISFFLRHPDFMWHTIVLSITSATGQLFIFHVISTYGPLVFTIIMTTRQVMSIFLSSFLFGHEFTAQGWLGIAIVIGSLYMNIYFKRQVRLGLK
eukprot:m.261053 g.261053  ORF g.261053 m.261053 type:complete len:440 (-) comp41179_c0_seq1:87-1406(-)